MSSNKVTNPAEMAKKGQDFLKKARKRKKKLQSMDQTCKKIKTVHPCHSNANTSIPVPVVQKYIGPPKDPSKISENWKKMKLELGLCKSSQKNSAKQPKLYSNTQNMQKDADRSNESEMHNAKWTLDSKTSVEVDQNTLRQNKFQGSSSDKHSALVKQSTHFGETRAIALDCEMVGVGEGGVDSNLARVSVVNQFGHCLLDRYVKPIEDVTDYRTHVSGITPTHIRNAHDFWHVQKEVAELMKGKVLVGHAIQNDLKVLYLDHPRRMIRDTSVYKPFRRLFNGSRPSLKKLTSKLLSYEIQTGEHNSVEDAQAAMRLYMMHRKEWERAVKPHSKFRRTNKDGNG